MINKFKFGSDDNIKEKEFHRLKSGDIFSFVSHPRALMIKTEENFGVSLIGGNCVRDITPSKKVYHFTAVDIVTNTNLPPEYY